MARIWQQSNYVQSITLRKVVRWTIVGILIGIWSPSVATSVFVSCANTLINKALYDSSIPQLERESMLHLVTRFLPSTKSSNITKVKSQEEALFLADINRKQGVISSTDWQYALNLPSLGKWPSFALPANLSFRDGNLHIPFDVRWNIRSTQEWKDGNWYGYKEFEANLFRSDSLLATAKNTDKYQLFMVTWDSFTADGPYSALQFEIKALPGSTLSINIRQNGKEPYRVPVQVNSVNWTKVVIPFPQSGLIEHVDFFVGDSNQTNESEFGVMIRNGIFLR